MSSTKHVNGVSITNGAGNPVLKHIWTYATAAAALQYDPNPVSVSPCNSDIPRQAPSYVGSD